MAGAKSYVVCQQVHRGYSPGIQKNGKNGRGEHRFSSHFSARTCRQFSQKRSLHSKKKVTRAALRIAKNANHTGYFLRKNRKP
jgi:hypothetical protein